MTDIDYHTIYTQFLIDFANGLRPSAIITKGFLGKIPNPCPRINIYQVVSKKPNKQLLDSIKLNSSHPNIQSFKILKHESTTLDPLLAPTIINYGSTYSDMLSHMDPNAVNILLYDAVVIDHVWTDYIGHVTPGTLGVLSSKTFTRGVPIDTAVYNDNSKYTYSIDNFNGFVFYGRPNIDVPYYPNIFGSKHMFIKKFYASKQNIVNLANIIPCYMFSVNTDYVTTESYMMNPSFSVMIVQPQQESVTSDLIIDEEDMFKKIDTEPLKDTTVAYNEVQTDLESYIPFLNRLDLSEFDHKMRVYFYNKHHHEHEMKHKQILEHQIRMMKDFEEQMKELRSAQFSKIDEDYKAKTRELIAKYSNMESQLESELNAHRTKKMQEIDDKVNAEIDLIREKKIIEVESETKSLYETLDAKYSAAQKERQAAISAYEKDEHARIDKEIQDIYDTKYSDLLKRLDTQRKEIEATHEKLRNEMEDKIRTELRSDYVLKYNDEYIKTLAQLMKTVEQRRNEMMVSLEGEIQAIRERKSKDVEIWESGQYAKLSSVLTDYELEQKAKIHEMLKKMHTEGVETVKLQLDQVYKLDSTKNIKRLEGELNTLKVIETQRIHETLSKLMEDKKCQIEKDIVCLREAKQSEIALFEKSELAKVSKNIELFEKSQKQEAIARVKLVETEEIDKLLRERETVVQEKVDAILGAKTAEALKMHQSRVVELDTDYARRKNDLEQTYIQHCKKYEDDFKKLVDSEEARVKEYAKTFNEKVTKEENRIREDILSSRKLYVETEVSKMREKFMKELEAEFEGHKNQLKKQNEDAKIQYKKELDGALAIMKDSQMLEFDKWTMAERANIKKTIDIQTAKMESDLKEMYETKKFEYAQFLTKEMLEIEQSRIKYHTREQSRLAAELVSIREKALESIQHDVDQSKIEMLEKVKQDVEEHRLRMIKTIEEQVVSQTDIIFHDKIKEIEATLEPTIIERMNATTETRKIEIEKELQVEKLELLKQVDAEVSAIRAAAISEVEADFTRLKEDRNKELEVIDSNIQEHKKARLSEVEREIEDAKEKLLAEMQQKAEKEHHENEQKRKLKIREMEEMLAKLHA